MNPVKRDKQCAMIMMCQDCGGCWISNADHRDVRELEIIIIIIVIMWDVAQSFFGYWWHLMLSSCSLNVHCSLRFCNFQPQPWKQLVLDISLMILKFFCLYFNYLWIWFLLILKVLNSEIKIHGNWCRVKNQLGRSIFLLIKFLVLVTKYQKNLRVKWKN